MLRLNISMHEAEKLSLERLVAFLKASRGIRFEGQAQAVRSIAGWSKFVSAEYHQQGRRARGLFRRYMEKMTGMSRAQVTRLIARYRQAVGCGPALPAASFPAALHSGRHRTAGRRR